MPAIATLNYTPPSSGALTAVVTATFDAETSQPIDFGAGVSYRVEVVQAGVSKTSQDQRLAKARARYALDWSTTIDPGVPCVFNLLLISSAVCTLYAATLKVEIIKR